MALNIPNQMATGFEPMQKGFTTGSNFYRQLVQNATNRANTQHMQTMEPFEIQHLKAMMANAAAANSRAGQARSEAHQNYLNSQNPDYAINRFMHEMNALGNMNSGQAAEQQQQPQQFNALRDMMQNQGMPQGQGAMMQPEEQQQPEMMGAPEQQEMQQPHQPQHQGLDWNNLNPLQKMYAVKSGYKMPVETPEAKRAATLQDKLAFENAKIDLGSEKEKQKAVLSAKKDLPQLQQSLQGVDELLDIAKENPDLFGHYMAPDLFAKTTKNKKAGVFQNLLADRIAGLESKLSSKGNIVALKMAAQLKPSFGEQQNVAIGKLESMRKELKNALDRNLELVGGPVQSQSSSNKDPLGLFGE